MRQSDFFGPPPPVTSRGHGNLAMEVVLTGVGSMMVPVIKVIREATGLGLKETKALVDDVPSVVREGLGELEAGNLKAKLEEAGATVELR